MASSAIVARNDPEHKDALLLASTDTTDDYVSKRLAAPKYTHLYRMYIP